MESWIEAIAAVVSIIIAIVALLQSYKSIELSNRQLLFEKRINVWIFVSDLNVMYEQTREHIIEYILVDYDIDINLDYLYIWLTDCEEFKGTGLDLLLLTASDSMSERNESSQKIRAVTKELMRLSASLDFILPTLLASVTKHFVDTYLAFLIAIVRYQEYISTVQDNKQNEYGEKVKRIASMLDDAYRQFNSDNVQNEAKKLLTLN